MPTKKSKVTKTAEKPKKRIQAKSAKKVALVLPAKKSLPKKVKKAEVLQVEETEKKADKVIASEKHPQEAKKRLFENLPSAKYFYSVGRRKTAIAQVRLYEGGKGNVVVNGKDAEVFFGGSQFFTHSILSPLELVGMTKKYDVYIKVKGGGVSSIADAARLGAARALLLVDHELKATLRKAGFLTRDPRVKERKKPGLKRARRAPQFSKR